MVSLIEQSKADAVSAMEHFLMVFSKVPAERLEWSPVPSAKSALRIAAHTAVIAGHFARMLRAQRLPVADEIPAAIAEMEAAEQAITTPEEMERVYRENTRLVVEALDALPEEAVGLTLDSGMGWTMPMTFLISLPSIHAWSHTAQIDYLQTCWGDHTIYVG